MRRLVRQSWDFVRWVCYLTVIVAALTIAVSRLLVHQIFQHQEQIESTLSAALGVPVRADSAAAYWSGLYPRIELTGVRVGDDPDAPLMAIGQMRAVPDFLESFRYRAAVWQELIISDMQMVVAKGADGRWQIAGQTAAAGGSSNLTRRALDMFLLSERIEISGVQLLLRPSDQELVPASLVHLLATSERGNHALTFDGWLGSEQNGIVGGMLLAHVEEGQSAAEGRGYVTLAANEPGDLPALLMEGVVDAFQTAQLELWIDFQPGRPAEFNGAGAFTGLQLPGFGEMSGSGQVGGLLHWDGWNLQFQDFEIAGLDAEPETLNFSVGRRANLLEIAGADLDIQYWAARLVEMESLADPVREALRSIAPRGLLTAAHFQVPLNDWANWRFTANLGRVDMSPYNRAPGVQGLSGFVSMTPQAGRLVLDAEDMQVDFANIYDAPIEHDWVRGQIDWRIAPREGLLTIYSGPMTSQGAYGSARSSFLLTMPIGGADLVPDFTLLVALENGRAERWPDLVPTQVPEELQDWLRSSSVTGDLIEAAFIYRGSPRPGAGVRRTLQLAATFANLDLAFSEGWPRIEDAGGQYFVSDVSFSARGIEATSAGVAVSEATVAISGREQRRLQIQTDLRGDLDAFIDLVRNTPAGPQLGSSIDGLRGVGAVAGRLALGMPLRYTDQYADLTAQGELHLTDNTLIFESLDLALENISGSIIYADGELRSENLESRFWDHPLQLELSTGDDYSIELDTQVDIEKLRTGLSVPLMQGLSGIMEVDGHIRIPKSGLAGATVSLFSSTQGITSTAPGLLAKAANELRPLEVTLSLNGDRALADLSWSPMLSLALETASASGASAIAFGLDAPRPALVAGHIRGAVRIDELDLQAMQAWLIDDDLNDGDLVSDLATDIRLRAHRVVFGGFDMGPMQSHLTSQAQQWNAAFEASFGGGDLAFDMAHMDAGYKLAFHWADLKTLRAIAATRKNEQDQDADMVAPNYDPRLVPAMDLSIDALQYADRDLGAWQMKLVPTDLGLVVRDLVAEVGGAVVDTRGSDALEWSRVGDNHSTQARFTTDIANIADLFSSFGQPRAVSSEDGALVVELEWPNAPYGVRFADLTGFVDINLNRGSFDAEMQGVGNALMTLIGLFSIDNWERRLRFDFSDLADEGTSYSSIRGRFGLQNGILTTLNPINISLVTGRLRFAGEVDMTANRVDGELVATLPVRNNLAWVTAVVAGLPAAAGAWLFGEVFRAQLDELASVTYEVTGDLDAPEVKPKAATRP